MSNNQGITSKTCEVIVQARKDIFESRPSDFEFIKHANMKSVPYNWESELPSD